MNKLIPYKQKRTFKDTPEPSRSTAASTARSRCFVVQKHAASHLHYDFRLELDGVLKSWAIPKGPSLNPNDKRLAIMVEDHPLDYRTFEGVIPEGNYGAGTVMVWDEGTYELTDHDSVTAIRAALKDGKIDLIIHGSKLKGMFTLVRLKDEKSWLLIKKKDAYTRDAFPPSFEESVLTHRTMDEIAHGKIGKKKAHVKKTQTMLHHIKPMLATLVNEPFDAPDWIFEVKWDGYRAIAEVDNQSVKLYSRNQVSFNDKFPAIVEELKTLGVSAVFDGEVVIFDKQGKSNFQLLQNYQRTKKGSPVYCVFDFLYLNGEDLRSLPLLERKKRLAAIIGKHSSLRYSDHIEAQGKAFFRSAEKHHLEGVMAKNGQSPYVQQRSRDWVKIKTQNRQEVVIGGFTDPQGGRQYFGSLILGVYKNGKLVPVGNVGTGFSERNQKDIYNKLIKLQTEQSPFTPIPKANTLITWVKPKLLCEVHFAEWTSEGQMRQPAFLGLRSDKDPKTVVEEKPEPLTARNKTSTHTNLDKVFWPKEGYTKGDLLHYYENIAPFILPYLKNRPESLNRYPDGIEGNHFFNKDVHNLPKGIKSAQINDVNYLLIQDKESLLYAINLGCIELNPFNARIGHLNNPDYLIIDLDPEGITFEKVIEVAQAVHKLLDKIGVPNLCKTSGGRGLHILIPLKAKYTYDQVRAFAELVCALINKKYPTITSMKRRPSTRQKRVYLDYLQNREGQTLAAPYCVRPRPGAPVSTPLKWSEVKPGLNPLDFNIKTITKRLAKTGDLLKPILQKGTNLEKALAQLEKIDL